MPTILLDSAAVKRLLNMPDVIAAVEEAFKLWGQGKGNMPAKAYLSLERGDFRAMPAALPGSAGIKWVNVHPQNRSRNLPTVMAVIIYNDPETGYPLAVIAATDITAYRTGAAAAIASKHLAGRNSQTLGIIGAGRQAYTQILAHSETFNLNSIKVFDVSSDAADKLVGSLPGFPIKTSSIQDALHSDIVCTVTPSRQPIVRKEWVMLGTHINAIGADAPGKEELDPAILKDAIVVVDDLRQASGGGEINVPISKGIYNARQVRGTLAEIVLGKKPGRASDRDITVFDSTGIAIEDLAVARVIYQKAQQESCPSIDLV